jgi:hypothetical protein
MFNVECSKKPLATCDLYFDTFLLISFKYVFFPYITRVEFGCLSYFDTYV